MGVHIFLHDGKRPDFASGPLLALPDRDFNLLEPLWDELRRRSGVAVDPYADLRLASETLDALQGAITTTRAGATGALAALLDALDAAIVQARQQQRGLFFHGD